MASTAPAISRARAARYDAQEPLEVRAVDAALRLVAPTRADRLVDLGTGTGLVLRRLARSATAPASAVGVDHSGAMLERVGELPPGWSTVRADARAVPWPDGSADVVICSYLLHLLCASQRAGVLAEARRLLSPEGRLAVVTVWCARRAPGGRVGHALLSAAARARPAALGGLRPLDPTPDLERARFAVSRRAHLPRRGYPSLVLAARPTCTQEPAVGTGTVTVLPP